MLLLYLNTTTGEWFDADGNPFGYDMPRLAYQARGEIAIFLKTDTSGSGELGNDPASWPADVLIAQTPNVGAKITIDSDYIHKLKGTVSTAVSAGNVAEIKANIAQATSAAIPTQGALRLFSNNGKAEVLNYTNRTVSGKEVTFQLAEGTVVANSYSEGAVMDCDQAPYCQAFYNPEKTMRDMGLWRFDLTVDSERLRSVVDYSDTAEVPVEGLEVLFYTVDADGNEYPLQAFLLNTLTISATLGTLNAHGELPEPMRNEVTALVGSLLDRGLEVETRNGAQGAELRIKLANLGADTWSDWMVVGYSLAMQYSIDGVSWSDTASANSTFMRFSADGGKTWGAAISAKGADGINGVDGKDGADGTSAGFGEITSTTETLEAGNTASVTVTATGEDSAKNFQFDFQIPRGEKGDAGESFTPDQTGTTDELSMYDDMPAGFAFLDITEGVIYFKQSDAEGDWSAGMPFGKGEKGDTGAAAGFGTPEITVTTLDTGANATAKVTASGENTAKVFRFELGIPKGEKGEITEADKQELLTDVKAYVQTELANGSW